MAVPRPSKFTATLAVSLFLCASSAAAADWYVDAIHGANGNNGTSPQTPWKTITHALAMVSSTPNVETIHVAAGVYDTASGEVFPLHVRDRMQVVGDAGPLVTTVVGLMGPPFLATFQIDGDVTVNPNGVSSATLIAGMTLKNGHAGVAIFVDTANCDPVVRDLVVQDCYWGVVVVPPTTADAPASSSARIERVKIIRVAMPPTMSGFPGILRGVYVSVGPAISAASADAEFVRLIDCTLDGCTDPLIVTGYGRTAKVELDRCRFTRSLNTLWVQGLIPSQGGLGASISLRNCLADHNTSPTFLRLRDQPGTRQHATISGCTFANNTGYAIREDGGMLDIENSILWGNGTDIVASLPTKVSNCDIGSGFHPAGLATIQSDPLFVDAANGDYRLRFGSPCIDRGAGTPNSLVDYTGLSRRLDGDLDTIVAPDMGAFELETLRLLGLPRAGEQIGLEFHGGAGAQATLYMARAAPSIPVFTQYGALYLDRQQIVRLGAVSTQPNPAHVMQLVIPDNPALIGTTFSFQALTDSVLAPTGRAFTNPVSFVIMP